MKLYKKISALGLITFPLYIIFNNILTFPDVIFCEKTFNVLIFGTACNLEESLSEKIEFNTCQHYFFMLKICVLLMPLLLNSIKPNKYYRVPLYMSIVMLFIDFLGIISYALDRLQLSNDLFTLHFSNIRLYLMSKHFNIARVTIPCLTLGLTTTLYFGVLFKKKSISTKKVYLLIVGASLSLLFYYILFRIYKFA